MKNGRSEMKAELGMEGVCTPPRYRTACRGHDVRAPWYYLDAHTAAEAKKEAIRLLGEGFYHHEIVVEEYNPGPGEPWVTIAIRQIGGNSRPGKWRGTYY